MFRGSVKSTGYTLHSPVSPSLPLRCVTVCHHISTGLYCRCFVCSRPAVDSRSRYRYQRHSSVCAVNTKIVRPFRLGLLPHIYIYIYVYKMRGSKFFVSKIRDHLHRCGRQTCEAKRGPYRHPQTLCSQSSIGRAVTTEAFIRSQVRACGICGGLNPSATGLSTSASVPPLSFRHFFILIFVLILSFIIRTSGREVWTLKQRISIAVIEAYWTET